VGSNSSDKSSESCYVIAVHFGLHRWSAIALSHDRGRAHAVARTNCARSRKWFSSISISTKQAISLTALGIIRKFSVQGKGLKLPDSVRLEIPCIGKNE
jgi:hypothetical protein